MCIENYQFINKRSLYKKVSTFLWLSYWKVKYKKLTLMGMNRFIITTIMLCCFSLIAVAQQQTLNGIIRDDLGEPLPGVNVLVKGTTNGVVSDFDGQYSITTTNGETLVFSYVGFVTKEIAYTGQTELNVTLKTDSNVLDEVVVVGYGSLRRKDITGSVASVKVDDTFTKQIQTVDQMLKGRVAGVQMIGNDGAPNSGISIKIRGTSSLRGDNEPLYVVDGVILSSAGQDAAAASSISGSIQIAQNGLNGINPRDIVSMEILKDASATAIYGSRAANGVVLITTKRGTSGRTKVSAYATTSVTYIDKKMDVLRGVDFARYRNEAAALVDSPAPYQIVNGEVYPVNYDTDIDLEGTVDAEPSPMYYYQDELYTMGTSYTAGASISGGGEKSNHFVSFGYNKLGGITENAELKSGNIRINLGQKVSDNLQFDTRLSAYLGKGSSYQDADQWGGNRSFIYASQTRNPIANNHENNPELQTDPLLALTDFEDKSKETRFIGSLSLKYKLPVQGLSYSFLAGGNLRNKERRRWYGPLTLQGQQSNGALGISKLTSSQFNIDNLIHYNRTFSNIHRITAMAGFTYEERQNENSIYAVEDFGTYTFTSRQPSYGQLVTRPTDILSIKSQMLSYISRVNYSFNDKYIATVSFRADGSSKFSKENRFSYFPSFALAWRLSEEPFIKSMGVFNDLKFRVGYGEIGNQAINPYQTYSNYSSGMYSTTSNSTGITFSQENIANPDLKWETTVQTNVGLDFELFDSRISGSFDAFTKDTEDLLQQVNLPGSTGFASMAVNRGGLNAKGVEVALNAVLVQNEDIRLEIGGNIGVYKSTISYLDSPAQSLYIGDNEESRSFYLGSTVGTTGPYNIFIEGEEIGLFYGYRTDGIYQEGDTDILDGYVPGDIKFVDMNGDGDINLKDRTIIGNPNPDFTYGANLNFSYKNFSISAQFDGVYGNDIATGIFETIDIAQGGYYNITPAAYNQAWRPDAPSTTYPRIHASVNGMGAPTDRIIQDGSYFRLNNLTIGYDVPLVGEVSNLRIYLAATNLFTLTNYRGYTPIITSYLNHPSIMGVDWVNPPNAQSVSMGLTVNF